MTTSPTTPPVPGGAATAGTAVVDPATGRPAGRAQLILLLAASCMSVLGAVLIAPVLPQIAGRVRRRAGRRGARPDRAHRARADHRPDRRRSPGAIVDRFDRKRLLLVAMVGYTIFGTAPLYLASLGAILGSRVLVGVCEAAIMTCCDDADR